jgi:ABC-2 type transport system ATP-binding protein
VPTNRSSSTTSAVRPAISVRDASKVFASGDGVHHLDLDVAAGSIFGFIGPSGSGKTTTVRMLTGVVEPDDGTIEVLGEDPTRFDAGTRSRLGYLPQLSVLYPQLTVGENLRFYAALYGLSGKRSRTQRSEVLEFVDLANDEGKRVEEVSGGMQRRLSLAASLVHDPEMLFLDEPTAGVDPMLRRRFWDHFTDLRDEGRTLFVTTQYVGEAAYCDQVGVLDEGRLLLVDSPDGLRRAAFGGDVVDVEFAVPPGDELVADLTDAVSASSNERRGSVLRLVVDEAATALPELAAWLSARDVEVVGAEEHLPPYDDVFVELVERFRAQSAAVGVTDR